jgi:hypothetical protein
MKIIIAVITHFIIPTNQSHSNPINVFLAAAMSSWHINLCDDLWTQ